MKKHITKLLAVALAGLCLAACGAEKNPSGSSAKPTSSDTSSAQESSQAPTPVSSETPTPSSSETPTPVSSSEAPDEGYDELGPNLDGDTTPVPTADQETSEALADGVQTRDYNSNFDAMLNDFSGTMDANKLSDGAVANNSPYLKVRLNSSNSVFPNSDDKSIYKAATGAYAIHEGYSIGFKMKLHDSKKVGLNHLVLALRGDDALQTYPIALDKAVDPDGDALPALTNEYQEYVISPMSTISNEETPYKNKDGSYSTTKVLNIILGFHLYAAGNVDATIDIGEVFLRKEGMSDAVLDNFEHTKPNDSTANLWWRDSTGTIVGRNLTLNSGAGYTETITSEQAKKNLVLSIKGDTKGTSLVFSDGTESKTVAWKDLKNAEETPAALPDALQNTYASYVINLANSGVTFTPTSVKVVSTTEVVVNQIFFSDLEDRENEQYPTIDQNTIKVFDDFNRSQTGINSDYDASHSSEIVKGAGLDYVLSYNAATAGYISIDGSQAVLAGSKLGKDEYMQLKIGSDAHARTNEDYLVFAVKLGEGATMDTFRFGDNNNNFFWANDWKAGFGVKSLDTPYTSENGYSLYVIDLEETGANITNTIDMYYSGAGDLMIDQIFFANDYADFEVDVDDVNTDLKDKTIDTSGAYVYAYGGLLNGTDSIIGLTLKGDGEATLKSVRLQLNGVTQWFKDKAIKDPYGHVIDADAVIPTDGETIMIDLEKSGFPLTGDKNLHIHAADLAGCTGTITLEKLSSYKTVEEKNKLVSSAMEIDLSAYKYVGWMGNKHQTNRQTYLNIKVKGDGTANLGTFRMAAGGKEYWFDSTVEGRNPIILADGTVAKAEALSTEDTIISIDITKTGITLNGEAHMHIGGGTTGSVTIEEIELVSQVPTYETIYNGLYYVA